MFIYFIHIFPSSQKTFILPTWTFFGKPNTHMQDKNIGNNISRLLVTILRSFCAHTSKIEIKLKCMCKCGCAANKIKKKERERCK